jgi:hypothetical protein
MMPTFPDDPQRDAARDEWNAALASGDNELIEAVKTKLLNTIHVRIMDDDENYETAGYKPTID